MAQEWRGRIGVGDAVVDMGAIPIGIGRAVDLAAPLVVMQVRDTLLLDNREFPIRQAPRLQELHRSATDKSLADNARARRVRLAERRPADRRRLLSTAAAVDRSYDKETPLEAKSWLR